jgi:growth factor-regulated tyrosine kinase substrate
MPASLPQPSQVSNPQPQAPPQQPAFAPSKSTSSALSGLSRHNTTYTSHRSQQSPNSYLSRHNTISTAHPPHAQQQPSLSQFPVAPTSAPQTFPMYGPSILSGVPQLERKEALLIDL